MNTASMDKLAAIVDASRSRRRLLAGLLGGALAVRVGSIAVAGAVTGHGGGFTETIAACDGTILDVTGTAHGVSHFSQDAAGHTHLRVLTVLQGGAVDPASGARYKFHQTEENDILKDDGGAASYTFTSTPRLRLIRVGKPAPGDDLFARTLVHTTVNANGEVTVDVADISEACR